MQIVYQTIFLIASLLIVGKSAELIIKNLVRLASVLSWNRFIVAFAILGIATSTPEFFVGINSAIDKNPQLSLGNIIGATIVLLGLVVGATAFFSGRVVLSVWFTKKEVYLMNGVIILPIFLLYDAILSRFDAIVIISLYAIYIYIVNYRIHKQNNFPRHTIESETSETKLEKASFSLLMGFLGIFIFSRLAVDSAIFLGNALKIQSLILGILLFSIGTNLPEIVLTFTALKKRAKTIVVGNVLGSATTNSLVLAVVSLIEPIKITDFETFAVSVIFFIATVICFSVIIKSKNDVSKKEGLFLLGIYVAFVITEVVTKFL
jgi:cation:H+ antiporter